MIVAQSVSAVRVPLILAIAGVVRVLLESVIEFVVVTGGAANTPSQRKKVVASRVPVARILIRAMVLSRICLPLS